MITKSSYIFLYSLLAIVIGCGLFIPLMENDSAQHATMAMRMTKTNDYLEIFKGFNPYLDKPHMHFWLSALSFEIFGVEVWAYRLPAISLTLLGGFGIFRLTKLLYKKIETARLSALIFLTSQAIILSLHDVRTDAVLTGFTILAVWQWTKFLKFNSLSGTLWGGLFTAFAYSTKGMFAVAIIGLFLFLLVLYHNYWRRLLNYKLALGVFTFLLGSMPMFYAYYHQFGWEGIEFITYGQSTGRFSGEEFGTASSNDYAFYFHTMLWAFLPWSLWFFYSVFLQGKTWFKSINPIEIATIGTVLIFMIFMNFSQFKLPHYLNIVLPFAAIFTAHSVLQNFEKKKHLFSYTMYFMVVIGGLILSYLAFFAFPIQSIAWILLLLLIGIGIIYLYFKSNFSLEKMILLGSGFFLIANVYLNSTFYPELLNYQSGYVLGKQASKLQIDPKNLYALNRDEHWALDWQMGETIQNINSEELNEIQQKEFWVFTYQNPFETFNTNFKILKSYQTPHYRISRIKYQFINPKTRSYSTENVWLIKVEKEL